MLALALEEKKYKSFATIKMFSTTYIVYSVWLLVRLCLHVSSAQRSAQELPAVERQDLDRCSVLGGQQMVLTGQNFTSESKVIFSEKTQGEILFLFGKHLSTDISNS